MYELNDTVVAVSSAPAGQRVIVRLTGPKTIEVLQQIFNPPIVKDEAGLTFGSIVIESELRIDAIVYLFLAPHSYTAETLAEIHIHTNPSVTETLLGSLLAKGLRMAGPGEFTARAYLNNKIDLAQAEAVNEVITGSNRFQLAAAEKLLAGRLSETTAQIRSGLMDCLSLIEAGLDFSGEDIEFITRPEAVERLGQLKSQLKQLLAGSISYEAMIDLPAAGIAGAPNAGKSSLCNCLLGKARSIVSAQRKTTRDVLTGTLTLSHCRCVLFDCAGLIPEPNNILDELAQQAAIKALQNSSIVVFCVDISQRVSSPWAEDIAISELIEPQALIAVAAKSDLLSENDVSRRLDELNKLFGAEFIPTSSKIGTGLELLKEAIDKKIIEQTLGGVKPGAGYEIADTRHGLALTARHKQAVTEAIGNISEAINELNAGNEEVTAMMLRAAYQSISNIEQESIDEQILEKIFSRFCIGK